MFHIFKYEIAFLSYTIMECLICMEDVTCDRFLIECPFCLNDSVCVHCASNYILSGGDNKGCILCHKIWDLEYISYMFGEKVKNKYIENYKSFLLEREKNLIASTQHLVDYGRKRRLAIQRNKILSKLINAWKDIECNHISDIDDDLLCFDQIRSLTFEISKNRRDINDFNISQNIESYIMACPLDNCKGFVERKTTKCSVCNIKVCESCHNILKKKHKCNPEDVKSVSFLLRDTKACPECKTRVHKIDGCNQMFCTNCRTAFDWISLRKINGIIHNPHYHEMVANGLIQQENIDDSDINFIRSFSECFNYNKKINKSMIKLFYRVAEIADYVEAIESPTFVQDYDKLLTDERLDYILGFIKSDEEYKEKIYQIEEYIKKSKAEKIALENFLSLISCKIKTVIDENPNIGKSADGFWFGAIPSLANRKKMEAVCEDLFEYCNFVFSMTNEILSQNGLNLVSDFRSDKQTFFEGFRSKEFYIREGLDELKDELKYLIFEDEDDIYFIDHIEDSDSDQE